MYLDSVLHTWFSSRVDDSILYFSLSLLLFHLLLSNYFVLVSVSLDGYFYFHKSRESLNFSFLLILSSSRCGGGGL